MERSPAEQEVESVDERNRRIRAYLDEGRIPLLPFEVESLENQLKELMGEQNELSRLLGEAMNQSSETWHDNAPADAVNIASKTLSIRGRRIVDTLLDAERIDYAEDTDVITVGSIVGLKFSEDSDTEFFLLLGTTTPMGEELSGSLPDGCLSIGVRSPIGSAILDARAGSRVEYVANGATRDVFVESVTQFQG